LGDDRTGDNRFTGEIGEFIYYDRLLSTVDRHKVETYLAVKYGVTLGHNYYNSSYTGAGNAANTILYDVSTGYGNDIAGIGRDDLGGLNQAKSKSENSDAVITVSSPTSLDNGDYLLWGNNNLVGTRTTDLPNTYSERLQRVWFFDEKGDVGTISMKFDLSQLGDRSSNPTDYAILINHSSPSFASPNLVVTNGASIVNQILTFTNVPIQDGAYLSLAVAPKRGPGAIGVGLNMWLKASSVTLDLDGSSLDLWQDQSGNSNSPEPVPFNRPVVEPTLKLNNNQFLNFTADNGGQVTLSSVNNASTFLAVLKSATNGTDVFERNNNTNPRFEVEGGFFRGNANAAFASTTPTNRWNIAGLMNNNATDHIIYMNGIQEDTDNASVTLPASTAYNLFTDFTGEVAEVLYYDVSLNANDRRQVESYLAIKYGITLNITAQDYLNGAGTSILNRTNFASYANNIAGIGKANAGSGPNAQGLNQTKSRSINTSAIIEVSAASNLDDGEYLVWGSNNTTALASITEVTPSPAITGVTRILNRKWRVTETGETGTVSVSFDLNSVTTVSGREWTKYTLVIDDTEDMSSPISFLKPASRANGIITFTGVNLNEGNFLVLGTNVASSPGGVSTANLLWLKANVGTNTTTNGAAVTAWAGQSASANNATGTGLTTYLTSFANFNPGLSFTDDSRPISGNIARTNGTASTIFVVGQIPSVSQRALIEIGTATGRGFFLDQRYASTNNSYSLQTNAKSVWAVSDPGGTTAASIFQQGTNIHTQTKTTTTNWTTGGAYYLGDRRPGDTNQLTGQIAEVIFYDQQLSASDQQKVQTYLAIKYGITLTHNYYSTSYNGSNGASTTIYDISTYPNDIAGIGRDDSEVLIQSQSKSENSDATITVSGATSLGSGEYLIWGNDDAVKAETQTGVPGGVIDMLSRKWRIKETGDVGTVTITFDVSGITGVGTSATDFALIIDGDATFNDGDEVLVPANSFAGNIVTFNNVDFNDGNIFSLATGVSSNLTEISTTVGDYRVTTSCPVLSGNSYIALRDANNRIVAEINPNGNNLGPTCWGVRVRASGDNDVLIANEDYFLDRNFYFTPTNQPTTSVSVRMYVLNGELADIRAKLSADGKSSGNDLNEYLQDFLRITKTSGEDLNPLSIGSGTVSLTPAASVYRTFGYGLEVSVTSFSEFNPGTDTENPSSILPIELAYFKALTEEGGVVLNWATYTEQDNDFFTIERSVNGSQFEALFEIDGAGDSQKKIYYESIDYQPLKGISYYRLKQTDFDGKFSYSGVVVVNNEYNGQSWIQYPNPTDGIVNFSFRQYDMTDISFEVINVLGAVQKAKVTWKGNTAKIDLSNYPKGTYFVRLSANGIQDVVRIIRR